MYPCGIQRKLKKQKEKSAQSKIQVLLESNLI